GNARGRQDRGGGGLSEQTLPIGGAMRKILLVMLLAGCGGGDGGSQAPPPDAKPGGFYIGNFTSSVSGESVVVGGVILESGEAIFMSDYGIYTAEFQPDEYAVDAEFKAFALWGTTWDG